MYDPIPIPSFIFILKISGNDLHLIFGGFEELKEKKILFCLFQNRGYKLIKKLQFSKRTVLYQQCC